MHISELMDTGQRWRSQRPSLTCSGCSHRDTGQDTEPVRLQYCLAISVLGCSVSCCREIKGQKKGRESTEKATNNPGRKAWTWVPDTRVGKEDNPICVRIKLLGTWWIKGSCLLLFWFKWHVYFGEHTADSVHFQLIISFTQPSMSESNDYFIKMWLFS